MQNPKAAAISKDRAMTDRRLAAATKCQFEGSQQGGRKADAISHAACGSTATQHNLERLGGNSSTSSSCKRLLRNISCSGGPIFFLLARVCPRPAVHLLSLHEIWKYTSASGAGKKDRSFAEMSVPEKPARVTLSSPSVFVPRNVTTPWFVI